MKEKIYGVMYNPMIHESCYGCLSIHKTRKGAEMAMEFHKKERSSEDDYDESIEYWNIYEYELND